MVLALLIGATLAAGPSMETHGKVGLVPETVNALVRAAWRAAGVVPTSPANDAQFYRRIHLDIIGTIPSAEKVARFLADSSPDKRARAVDALLEDSRYAEHWANYWDQVLMGRQTRSQLVDRIAFREWLKAQFAANVPYDRFVRELLTASGLNSTGGGVGRLVGLRLPGEPAADTADASGRSVNGAVNWTLKYLQTPADLAGTASRVFLGVQIQCAQCHDHKTEKWTQDDFRRFAACFSSVRAVPLDTGQVRGVRRMELREAPAALPRRPARQGLAEFAAYAPAALDGTALPAGGSRRNALADWITNQQNPWFARAIVNRMWAHFLGRGFVDPIDDFRPSNPVVLPELLDRLAVHFQATGYDLKQLIRLIVSTEVYQLSSRLGGKQDDGNQLWARFRLKPMEPETLVEALMTATGLGEILDRQARGNVEQLKALISRQFAFLFDVDEEFEQKEFQGTIPQALLFINGQLLSRATAPVEGSSLRRVLSEWSEDHERIARLYLCALGRKPTGAEISRWAAFVRQPREAVPAEVEERISPRDRVRVRMQGMRRMGADPLAGAPLPGSSSDPRDQAYEDMFWALLNSSEFAFIH